MKFFKSIAFLLLLLLPLRCLLQRRSQWRSKYVASGRWEDELAEAVSSVAFCKRREVLELPNNIPIFID